MPTKSFFTSKRMVKSLDVPLSGWQNAQTAKKKADRMDVELVLASDYGSVARKNNFLRESSYMYISKSKNGSQYLDSLGGNCEKGGRYVEGNFYFASWWSLWKSWGNPAFFFPIKWKIIASYVCKNKHCIHRRTILYKKTYKRLTQ